MIKKAGLVDESREEEISQIRQKYGMIKARNSLARLFESKWNNIMLKAKKAVFTAGYINQLLATDQQTVADPIVLLQQIVMDEYAPQIKVKRGLINSFENTKSSKMQENKGIKRYDEELAELE